jgi:hypothetical protein
MNKDVGCIANNPLTRSRDAPSPSGTRHLCQRCRSLQDSLRHRLSRRNIVLGNISD